MREILQHVRAADGLDGRQVEAVVPAPDRLAPAHRALLLDAQIPLVGADVLEELFVLTRERELDARAWADLADAGALIERERLLIADPLQDVLDVCHRRRRVDLDDVRVDELLPALARDGDAVVPVLDEIGVPDLVHLHRRQLRAFELREVDALPAIARFDLSRQERAVEVAIAPDAA